MPDPSFGVVGLALLPLIFFYVASKLTEDYKFFTIFFVSLGILSAFMETALIGSLVSNTGIQNAMAWLGYAIIVLWIFYLLFQLITIGFGSLTAVLERIKPKRRGRFEN